MLYHTRTVKGISVGFSAGYLKIDFVFENIYSYTNNIVQNIWAWVR
ncbi:MAG: hypothetical protein HY790_15005 [Deltaproteobacteria bacterium]|nr:hypothetical protein [Deltaproteobacteria bacterium]